jgi:hypothetical protein
MKRINRTSIIFAAFLALAAVLTTCHKEYFALDRLSDEIELEPELVAPVAYGSMTMEDIVERIDSMGYTEVDEEGLIYLVFADTGFSVMADTIVDIPDRLYSEYYIDSDVNTPAWLGSDVGDTVHFYKTESYEYAMEDNDRLDSVIIKGGEVTVDVASSFRHTGLLTISSSQIRNVARDTFYTMVVISDMSGGFTDHRVFDTDGYYLETEEKNDTSYIVIHYDLALINSGNPVEPDDECGILTNFLGIDFYSIFGYIDSRDLIDEGGTFDIPLYENNPELANLIFADPRINISTSTSIGIPMEIEMDSVISTSSRDGSLTELTFTGEYPFRIGAPDMDQIGERVATEIHINRTTSNIDELLASAPSRITYNVIGRTSTEEARDQHFVLDTSKLDLAMEFLMPMDLKCAAYSLQDTIEFGLGEDGIDTSLIKLLEVTMTTVNQLPIQMEVQLYLMDGNYSVLDSLFDERSVLLEAASVDADGKLLEAMEETNSAVFTAEKFGKLEDTEFAMIEAKLLTTDGGTQFVKLYTHYSLDFKLSIYGNFRVNTRESNGY